LGEVGERSIHLGLELPGVFGWPGGAAVPVCSAAAGVGAVGGIGPRGGRDALLASAAAARSAWLGGESAGALVAGWGAGDVPHALAAVAAHDGAPASSAGVRGEQGAADDGFPDEGAVGVGAVCGGRAETVGASAAGVAGLADQGGANPLGSGSRAGAVEPANSIGDLLVGDGLGARPAFDTHSRYCRTLYSSHTTNTRHRTGDGYWLCPPRWGVGDPM